MDREDIDMINIGLYNRFDAYYDNIRPNLLNQAKEKLVNSKLRLIKLPKGCPKIEIWFEDYKWHIYMDDEQYDVRCDNNGDHNWIHLKINKDGSNLKEQERHFEFADYLSKHEEQILQKLYNENERWFTQVKPPGMLLS